jgi:ubiquinone/menaquinone biosynthesis C-methylase UbiE
VESAETKGLMLNGGWRYDLGLWLVDGTLFRGQLRQLRQRTAKLAGVRDGDQVLDVGCGTGTLALEVAGRVGPSGHVVGIDPSAPQIARARAKAARRHLDVAFQTGVIERLPFPDQAFDAVLATLMLHHLPAPLKRQGLAEIARVLTSGGRLVIADFVPKSQRQRLAARFHAGGSRLQDLVALVTEAGFVDVGTEEMWAACFSAFPGAGFVSARRPH